MPTNPRMAERSSTLLFNEGVDGSAYREAETADITVSNGEYARDGGVTKRHGYSSLAILDGNDHPRALLPLPDEQVGVAYKRKFAGADNARLQANWHGNLRTVVESVGAPTVAAGSTTNVRSDQVMGDVMVVGGVVYVLQVTAWNLSVGRYGRWYLHQVTDTTSRLLGSGVLDADARTPVVTHADDKFIIAYIDGTAGGNLDAITVDTSAVASGVTTLATGTYRLDKLDAISIGTVSAIAASPTTTSIEVFRVDSALTVTHSITQATTNVVDCLSLAANSPSTSFHVAVSGSALDWTAYKFNLNLTLLLATSVISTAKGVRVGIGSSITDGASVGVVTCVETTSGVYHAHLTDDYATTTVSNLLPNARLLSKPFIDYSTAATSPGFDNDEDPLYGVCMTFETGRGAAAYVVRLPIETVDTPASNLDHNGVELVAVLAEAGAYIDQIRLPTVAGVATMTGPSATSEEPATDWYVPYVRVFEVVDPGGDDGVSLAAEGYALRTVKLEHAMHDVLPRSAGYAEVMQGGCLLRTHNGVILSETVPAVRPPAPDVVEKSSATGVLPAGTYTYYAALAYVDNRNIKWRGPVSDATTVVKASGAGVTRLVVDNLQLTIPTMRSADALGGSWYYELYRTAAGGSIARLVSNTNIDVRMDQTTDLLIHGEDDTELADNLLLYTVGELEAQPPPSACALTHHEDRVWLVDATDRRRVWYSKRRVEGFGWEFNSVLSITAPAPVRALYSLDDKLLLFTDSDVYALAGDGLDATGAGTQYVPERVVAGTGISGPYNGAVTPDGVIFHAEGSGMHLLDRALQLADISGPPSQLITTTPRMVVHIPALKRVMVLEGSARDGSDVDDDTYVLDYARGKSRWLTHTLAVTGYYQHDTVWAGGKQYFLTFRNGAAVDPRVLYRDTTTYEDDVGGAVTPVGVGAGIIVSYWRPRDAGLLDLFRIRRVHVVSSIEGTASNSGGLVLTHLPVPNPRGDLELYEWSEADLEGQNDGASLQTHVSTRVRNQRVHAATMTLSHGVATDTTERGPALHAIIVDWVPVGRAGRQGGWQNPTVTVL